jgi:hypothetical protein
VWFRMGAADSGTRGIAHATNRPGGSNGRRAAVVIGEKIAYHPWVSREGGASGEVVGVGLLLTPTTGFRPGGGRE